LFLPVKPDFQLPRFPILTVLTCVLCIGVFLHQINTWDEYESAFTSFCSDPKGRLTEMVMARIAGSDSDTACFDVLLDIDTSQDPAATIRIMADSMKPLVGLSAEDSRLYVLDKLTDQFRLYQIRVPTYPDNEFAYYTGSWNPITMVTSSFTHGSWSHLIFNLIFFFAFATTVEVLVGGVSFVLVIIAISVFGGAFSSMAASLIGAHYSSLGLSGVVMGMIGLNAYLLPSGAIRCYYWFIVIFGSIAVPAWALAIWYIGWDIYNLFANVNTGVVDVMAHVTGGAAGYLYGVAFLRGKRQQIRALRLVKPLGEPPPVI
jgi:membrane associated rhomboid family serine protease